MSGYQILVLTPFFMIREGVSIFCRMLLDNLSSDFHADYLEVGNRPGNHSFMRRFFYLIDSAHRLITKLRNCHYDVVHVNPSFSVYSLLRDSLYLSIISRFGHIDRTIVFFHGWDIGLAERMMSKSVWRSIFVEIYKGVGLIFVLHKRCEEQLLSMGINHQKIKVTTTMYVPSIGEGRRHSMENADERVIILFMSRMVEGKGAGIVAKVAKLLLENGYRDFHLIFAGVGPLLPELRKFTAENGLSEYVDIFGYVSGMKKQEILRKGDIFILPTWLHEGCPLAILEAMGAGQAVVSTPRGAIPDIVKDGENGFICDSKNPRVFYEAVRRLLDNRELLHNMQKVNKRKAEENYEAGTYMRSMEEVYLSVINRTTDPTGIGK